MTASIDHLQLSQGDRVRVTFVGDIDGDGDLTFDDSRAEFIPSPYLRHAHVELIAPTWDADGAVVSDRAGNIWQRMCGEWHALVVTGNRVERLRAPSYNVLKTDRGPLDLINNPAA